MNNARLVSWVFVLTLSGYPVIAGLSEIVGFANRPMSIVLRTAILAIALLALARVPRLRVRPAAAIFWLAWWLFWLLYLSRIAIDQLLNPDALKLPTIEYVTFALGVSLIPAVAMVAGDPARAMRDVPFQLIEVTVFGLLLNLWTIFFQGGLLGFVQFDVLRIETETLNPITIGHMGVTLLLLSTWLLQTRSGASTLARILLCVAIPLSVVAIAASGSRGPVMSLLLSLSAMVCARRAKVLNIWTSLMLLALSIAGWLFAGGGETLYLVERLSESAFADTSREELLADGLRVFLKNPLLGAGIEPLWTYPHNLILESFMAYGLLTGLTFIFMVMYSVVQALRLARLQPDQFWVTLLFFQYLASGMVSGSLYASAPLWVLMALVVALVHAKPASVRLQASRVIVSRAPRPTEVAPQF